ncbi:hypothetical protein QJS10_CPA06g00040 [Acorus calamus]|uniref:Terpene synthase metal-binding domain-containing protein n=1 Tax=Acorus calamus TaxID=4465 RepID=A0AAV9ENX2_ACOCL|nr:hypothetical protein QJS10_CPA06g00040 [Acorus calamus]
MSKTELLMTLADDTYDSYGSFEELEPFNDAIQRWDREAAHKLPEYMKVFVLKMFDTFSEYEEELREEGNAYRVDYQRRAMKALCQSYYDEFLWSHYGYIPKLDEHLKVSAVSVGYPIIHCLFMVGMGDIVTKEALDWVIHVPKINGVAGILCRLLDDMKPDKVEKEYIPTTIQCYAMEHGITEEEAKQQVRETLIEHQWKRLNEELLKPDPGIPMALHMLLFNQACVMAQIYNETDDGYNNPEDIKKYALMMYVDPVPI